MHNNDTQKGSLTDAFNNFGAAPSDDLWSSIENQLDEKKKRRFNIWWWTSGIIAASFISFMTINYLNSNSIKTEHLITKNIVSKHNKNSKERIKKSISKEKSVQVSMTFESQNVNTSFKKNTKNVTSSIKNSNYSVQKSNYKGHFTKTSVFTKEKELNEKEISIKDSSKISIEKTIVKAQKEDPIEESLLFTALPKWKITASFGNRYGLEKEKLPIVSDPTTFISENNSSFVNKNLSTELSLSRRFGERFWLESGGNFNCWNDAFQKPSNNLTSLRYLGIGVPIQLNYNYLNTGRCSFLLGGGMNYEYVFKKTQTTVPVYVIEGVDINQLISNSKIHLLSAQLQTSVEIKCFKQFSFVFEPLIKRTVLQDKKSFDIQAFNKKWWLGGTTGIVWRF